MKSIIRFLVLILAAGFLGGCASPSECSSPKAWTQIEPGMTRGQVHLRLGPPVAAENDQEVWHSQGWQLGVTYDREGKVIHAVNLYQPK